MKITPATILLIVSVIAAVIFAVLLIRHLLQIRKSEQQALIDAEREYAAKRVEQTTY